MTASVRDIVNGALELVGQVSGSGVQVYADDFAKRCAVRAFDMLFKKRNWDQYLKWSDFTLDGVTGIPPADLFEDVKDFEDFIGVYRENETKPLPLFPHNRAHQPLSGSRVLYWTSLPVSHVQYAKRKLLFYPATATTRVFVQARIYPIYPPKTNWDWSDMMHLDTSMLEEATAFVMLSVDAINADAANVCKSMMEARYVDIVSSLGSRPLPVKGHADIPYDWYVTP